MARRPTTPRSSSNGSAAICRRMPSPRCATPCSAAATATGPRPISRFRASSTSNWRRTARAASMRAARAMRAAISTANSRAGSPSLRPLAAKEFGVDSNFSRSADDEPLYRVEPVAPAAVNAVVALGGAAPMKVLVNTELQNKSGANASDRSTRHIEVQLPPGITYRVGDHLSVVPRNDPALVDSVARRFGFLPGRPDPVAGRRRPPRAIAGRRRGFGRAAADRICRVAAGRDPQADPDHVGTHALSGDQAEAAGLCRRRCRRHRTLSRGDSRQAQIGVRSAGGTSGLRTAVPRLSGNAVAAGAALLFDLVVAARAIPRTLQRHRRRGRGRGAFGTRRLQGRLLELSRRPPRRRDDPRHGARDQGRLPAARRSCRAAHHDRSRAPASRRSAASCRSAPRARPRARRSARRCCSSAAVIPIRIISTPTS